MKPFQVRKGLNAALESTANNLAVEIGAPLVFAHVRISRGELGGREHAWDIVGGLRATHIAVGKHDAAKPETEQPTDLKYEATFQRHIQVFGREATFLDWLTRYFHEKLSETFAKKDLRISHFTVKAEATQSSPLSTPLSLNGDELILSAEMVKQLAPVDGCKEYFGWLQETADATVSHATSQAGQLDFVAQRFIGLRHRAFELATSVPDSTGVLSELARYYLPASEAVDDDSKWRFLGALQTAFLYQRVAQQLLPECHAFVSVAASYPSDTIPADEAPLALFSVGLPGQEVTKIVDQVSKVLSNKIRHVVDPLKETAAKFHDPKLETFWRKAEVHAELLNIIDQEIKCAFPGPQFHTYRKGLLLWLCLLAEKLKQAKHEGRALNFSFVTTDLSEAKDSGLFEFVELQFSPDSLYVPFAEDGQSLEVGSVAAASAGNPPLGTIRGTLDFVLREVEKKNYAWFSEGKFALAWDATFPSKTPSYLLRFKENTWEVFQSQRVRLF